MKVRLRAFADFWYDFVVGDDWRGLAAVVLALLITYGIAQTSVAAWWVLPVVVLIALPWSLWREVHN